MPPPLRIIFAGTPDFAVPSLTAIAADKGMEILLVITQPDKPVGRKQEITPTPVNVAAKQLGFSVLQPTDINEKATSEKLQAINFDYLVVVAYGQILSRALLALPAKAPVNLHASLLPRWRGASPIQHAILAGDAASGVTVQRMVEELDAGPILAAATTPLAPRETAETLHDRLAMMGADLLLQTLNNVPREKPQNEKMAIVCRKLTRASGIVNAEAMTALEIDRRVRALVPWPGVRMMIDNEEVKILATALEASAEALSLPCTEGTTLFVTKLQAAGGKPMSGTDWKRGHGA